MYFLKPPKVLAVLVDLHHLNLKDDTLEVDENGNPVSPTPPDNDNHNDHHGDEQKNKEENHYGT